MSLRSADMTSASPGASMSAGPTLTMLSSSTRISAGFAQCRRTSSNRPPRITFRVGWDIGTLLRLGSAAGRQRPWKENSLDYDHHLEQHDPDQGEDDERPPRGGHLKEGRRGHDQISEPPIRVDELGDHRANHRKRDRGL